jgi:hypothetical protein
MALIVLAAAGLVLIVAGVAWVFPPAGLIAAGLSLVGAAYLIAEEREQ